MIICQEEFANRRQKLFAAMHPYSIAIVFAASQHLRNADTEFKYRQNSNFYYLTGFPEHDAVAVFVKAESTTEYILFNQVKDLEQEQWVGFRSGQEGALNDYGADQSYPIQELDSQMVQLLQGMQHVYYAFGRYYKFDNRFAKWINSVRDMYRKGINAPQNIINIETILHEMRMLKSPAEIQILKQAANITSQAFLKAMQCCKPEMYEYELHAQLLHEYYANGAQAESFPSIVASGNNSCVLHYDTNNRQFHSGELVLIDSGCEYQHYASDVSRTFPANGEFTEQQKLIYNVVLLAQHKAIEQIKPGNNWFNVQHAAIQTITEGLCELGILKGKVYELIAQEAYKPFYMHNIGHWIGIDVHDIGLYKTNAQWRVLQSGMCMTVEPGIYIMPGMKGVDKKWWGIGIRIEDDVLVTDIGNEVLTANIPKTISDIEAIMAGQI